MKTIEEHNQEILTRMETNYKTNVECPTCKKEVVYADDCILLTNPPRRRVKCSCGYTGTVLI